MTRPASSWVNFNGLWEYEPAAAGTPTLPFGRQLNGSVLVPFPVESCLSGVGITNKCVASRKWLHGRASGEWQWLTLLSMLGAGICGIES